MSMIFSLLSYLALIASVVCLILVLIVMFQNEQRGIAIVCLVLLLAFGVGYLVTFIFGWIKSSEWGITKIMFAWTAAILAGVIFYVVALALGFGFRSA